MVSNLLFKEKLFSYLLKGFHVYCFSRWLWPTLKIYILDFGKIVSDFIWKKQIPNFSKNHYLVITKNIFESLKNIAK